MTYKYYIQLLLLLLLLLNLCHHVLCFKILTKHSCNNHCKFAQKHTGTSLRVHSGAGLGGTLCADMSHACSATCTSRKHVKKKTNNSTAMIVPTFSPLTSILSTHLSITHTLSLSLTHTFKQIPSIIPLFCKCVLQEAVPAEIKAKVSRLCFLSA